MNYKKILKALTTVLSTMTVILVGLFSAEIRDVHASEIHGSVVTDVHTQFKIKDTASDTLKALKEIAAEDPDVTVLISKDTIEVNTYMPVSNDVELKINGKKVNIVNGQFQVTLSFLPKKSILRYQVKDINTPANKGKASVDNDGNAKIVNLVDFDEILTSMDEMNDDSTDSLLRSTPKEGRIVKAGTPVHCNRFNGPHSNHRYYGRTTNGQAYVNWYKSDCFDKWHAYGCPLTHADYKCNGLAKKSLIIAQKWVDGLLDAGIVTSLL